MWTENIYVFAKIMYLYRAFKEKVLYEKLIVLNDIRHKITKGILKTILDHFNRINS